MIIAVKKDKLLLFYVIANVVLVALMIMHTVAFIDNLKNDSYEEEKSKFANSVSVINHQTTFYLDNSKRIVRDWPQLVRLNDWTDSEIVENLSKQKVSIFTVLRCSRTVTSMTS